MTEATSGVTPNRTANNTPQTDLESQAPTWTIRQGAANTSALELARRFEALFAQEVVTDAQYANLASEALHEILKSFNGRGKAGSLASELERQLTYTMRRTMERNLENLIVRAHKRHKKQASKGNLKRQTEDATLEEHMKQGMRTAQVATEQGVDIAGAVQAFVEGSEI